MFKSLSFRKPFGVVIFSLAILLLIFYVVIPKPSQGSFKELVLDKYSNQIFESITTVRTTAKPEISHDTAKIDKFLSYMNNLDIKEYKNHMPDSDISNDISILTLQTDKRQLLVIFFYNNYIGIKDSTNNSKKDKIYGVIGDNIDYNYIDKILKDE